MWQTDLISLNSQQYQILAESICVITNESNVGGASLWRKESQGPMRLPRWSRKVNDTHTHTIIQLAESVVIHRRENLAKVETLRVWWLMRCYLTETNLPQSLWILAQTTQLPLSGLVGTAVLACISLISCTKYLFFKYKDIGIFTALSKAKPLNKDRHRARMDEVKVKRKVMRAWTRITGTNHRKVAELSSADDLRAWRSGGSVITVNWVTGLLHLSMKEAGQSKKSKQRMVV